MNDGHRPRRASPPETTTEDKVKRNAAPFNPPEDGIKQSAGRQLKSKGKLQSTSKPGAKPKVAPGPKRAAKAGAKPGVEQKRASPKPLGKDDSAALHAVELQLIRQTDAIEEHESDIARHTAIQTWTNILTLIFGIATTGLLLYLTYSQVSIARRQVDLEYAKAAPAFSVVVSRYGTADGPQTARIPVNVNDQFAQTGVSYYWTIGVHPDRIAGNKQELAEKLSDIIGGGDKEFFYRRLISDVPFVFLDGDASEKSVISLTKLHERAFVFDRVPVTSIEPFRDFRVVPLPRFPKAVSVSLIRGEATIKKVSAIQELTFVLSSSPDTLLTCTVRIFNYFSIESGATGFPATQVADEVALSNVIRQNGGPALLIIVPGDTAVEVEYVDVFGHDRAALFSGKGVNLDKVAIVRSSRVLDKPSASLLERRDLHPPKFLQSLEFVPTNSPCRSFI